MEFGILTVATNVSLWRGVSVCSGSYFRGETALAFMEGKEVRDEK
jgi:hypothetical protein